MPIARLAECVVPTRARHLHVCAPNAEQAGKGQARGDPSTRCLHLESFLVDPLFSPCSLSACPVKMIWALQGYALSPDGAAGTLQVPWAPLWALLTAKCLQESPPWVQFPQHRGDWASHGFPGSGTIQ